MGTGPVVRSDLVMVTQQEVSDVQVSETSSIFAAAPQQ